jgi:glucoamylase
MLPKAGTSFPGAWCRPQNDGPGLQAITYANRLMDSGKEDFVRQYLWTGDDNSHNGGTIKHDLEYVANNWTSNTCDLWEEIMSTDFFWNRHTMRKSLILGEAFARRLGDNTTADFYKNAAAQVTDKLRSHWNGQFVYESQNRQKDSSVIIAFNEGSLNDDFFPCSGQYAAATIVEFSKLFQDAYQINQIDTQAGVPGILYGRYENDRYDGGGPWILNTAALG